MTSSDRRLAAIMFTDIVGFSTMMAANEALALKSIATHRHLLTPLLSAHQGKLHKEMGDGTLSSFSSARQAVDCALALQQQLSAVGTFQIRIGLHIGEVVTSDDDILGDGVNIAARIEPLASAGGIAASKSFVDAIRSQSDVQFQSIGLKTLKNIGTPIEVFTTRTAVEAAPAGGDSSTSALPPDKPSIAVLPFRMLSEDVQITFLADGLAEDIVSLLARIPGFLVISRASSFAFRDWSGDLSSVARQLGVRYIVEGSLRTVGNKIRVTTQLHDVASAGVAWSGRHEVDRANADDLQDTIVRGIFSELEPELSRAEIALIHRLRPENVDAWACYRHGAGIIGVKGWTSETMVDALAHLRKALAIDADFALARAHYALLSAIGMNIGLLPKSEELMGEARAAAEQAATEDDNSSDVLGLAGCALADLGDRDHGRQLLERALHLDPSNAQAHVALGAIMAMIGNVEEGILRMRHGMQISPRDRRLGFWRWVLGALLLRTGNVDEALLEAKQASLGDPKFHHSRILEAAALVVMGREHEARQAIAAAKRICPQVTLNEVAISHGRKIGARLEPLWG